MCRHVTWSTKCKRSLVKYGLIYFFKYKSDNDQNTAMVFSSKGVDMQFAVTLKQVSVCKADSYSFRSQRQLQHLRSLPVHKVSCEALDL
jgi:hypothetical protein